MSNNGIRVYSAMELSKIAIEIKKLTKLNFKTKTAKDLITLAYFSALLELRHLHAALS